MEAQVLKAGLVDMQVCVPKDWTDEQVKKFSEKFSDQNNVSGTESGWRIMKTGHKYLAGDPERVQCSGSNEFVHIMLEC